MFPHRESVYDGCMRLGASRGKSVPRRVLPVLGLLGAMAACLTLFAIHVPGWHTHAQGDDPGRCITCRTIAGTPADVPEPCLDASRPALDARDAVPVDSVTASTADAPAVADPRGPPAGGPDTTTL